MKKFPLSWPLIGFSWIFVCVFVLCVFNPIPAPIAAVIQAEGLNVVTNLNVVTKGLDKVETYIIKDALTAHKLSVSTSITIEKKIVEKDSRKYNSVKVTAKIADKKYVGEVSERDFPQLDGREYYGLLQQAVNYACSGPESARHTMRVDSAFVVFSTMMKEEAEKRGHTAKFFTRNSGSNRTTFVIDEETIYEASWFPTGRDNKSLGYFAVQNRKMEYVNIAAIFSAIPPKAVLRPVSKK